MPNTQNDDDQDPQVRSVDPFRQDKDNPAADELAESEELENAGNQSARQQAAVAGSGTTGHEVEPEPNDDMDLEGFDKKQK